MQGQLSLHCHYKHQQVQAVPAAPGPGNPLRSPSLVFPHGSPKCFGTMRPCRGEEDSVAALLQDPGWAISPSCRGLFSCFFWHQELHPESAWWKHP